MNNLYEQEQLFYEVLKEKRGIREKSTSGKRKIKHCTLREAYDIFVARFVKRELPGQAIDYTTFTRWYKRKISEVERVKAEQGNAAAKELLQNKTGTLAREGFLMVTEADGFHEPIRLCDENTFKPLNVRPVHHFSVEQFTGAMHGYCTNYLTGSERADFVIESIKNMIMVKPNWQERYGSKFNYPMYGRSKLYVHDGHQAYLAGATDEILNLGYLDSATTSTKAPYEKPIVESINRSVKQGFTFKLDGSYNDSDDSIDFNAVEAIHTSLEHEVLLARYVTDILHQEPLDRLCGNTRHKQWEEEARIYGVTLPNRPHELLGFHGIQEFKTIEPHRGIQKKVDGKRYIFNSDQLQDLRIRLLKVKGKKWDGRVIIKYTLMHDEFIQVKDELQNKFIVVPLVTKDHRNQKKLAGYNDFVARFSEEQTIERLAKLSNDQIIENARTRKRMINQYLHQRKTSRKKDAITLEEAAKRDFNTLRELFRNGGALNEDGRSVPYEEVMNPEDQPIDHDFTLDDDLDFDL